jgi:DNA-binding PadR family transcriptional regulator
MHIGSTHQVINAMPATRHPDARLPLTAPVFHILLALADQERHGYGIILDIAERTAGRLRMGTGTLYTAVKRMLDDGLIEESDERPAPDLDDQRRRYYRLTRFGREVLAAEARRLESLVGMARRRRVLTPAGAKKGR